MVFEAVVISEIYFQHQNSVFQKKKSLEANTCTANFKWNKSWIIRSTKPDQWTLAERKWKNVFINIQSNLS
jgi:hypothetical protein